jgi:hypothetical protein
MFTGYILTGLALSGVLTVGESTVPAKPVTTAPRPLVLNDGVLPAPRKSPASTARIQACLVKPVTCSFQNVSLRHALDSLHTMSGLNFVLDGDALRDANISPDQPLTISVENISLRSILDLILKPAHLTYTVKDQFVLVTTPECARGRLKQVTYSVADLVVPVATPGESDTDGKARPQTTIEDRLINLIANTVAPDTWMNNGGPGTMQYFPLGMALVINQYQDVHEQIQELLCALRRLQDLEVALEIRLVQISDSMFAKTCSEKQGARGDWNSGLLLTERQRASMLTTLQASRRTNILQCPKVTLFNGQSAPVDLAERKSCVTVAAAVNKTEGGVQTETVASGWKYRICPVVSADRRTVRVKLELKRTDAENVMPASFTVNQAGAVSALLPSTKVELARIKTMSLEQSLSIPDGMTAVLYVGETVAKHQRAGRGREIQHYLVLVTPHIVVSEAQEEVRAPATGRW